MDRGRHRALLSVAATAGLAALALAGGLRAQGISPVPPAGPTPAAATPWVQASPPPSTPSAKPTSVAIRVDKDGRYYFDKEKDALPVDGLTDRLRQLHEVQKDNLRVLIHAEPDANFAAITTAMDRAREAGVKNVAFSLPPGSKAGSPAPSATPSKEDMAKVMARRREEELAGQASLAAKPAPHAEGPISPEEREVYEHNLSVWLALPLEEKRAIRGLATERIQEETEKAYESSGLTLNDDQREVFVLRYRQERRRLEREIQEKAKLERARRLPEIIERIKHEFPATAAVVSTPRPTPRTTSTPMPTTPAPLSPAK